MTAPHATHAGAGLRTIRAAVFTAVCVVLSAVGHAVASCATVPWWALGLGFLALFTVTAPLAGRRRSLPGIAGGLAVGQVALHAMFGLGQHGAAAPVDAASSDSSLAALAAQLICGGNSIPPSPEDARLILETAGLDPAAMVAQEHMAHAHMAHAPQTALLSPAMLLGHLLAALAAGFGCSGAATPPCSGSSSCHGCPRRRIRYVRCVPPLRWYGPSSPGCRAPRSVLCASPGARLPRRSPPVVERSSTQ